MQKKIHDQNFKILTFLFYSMSGPTVSLAKSKHAIYEFAPPYDLEGKNTIIIFLEKK